MGVRFRKTLFGSKFIRLNLSGSGVSASIGVPGLRYNVPVVSTRNRRPRITASLPGTGLSYSQSVGATSKPTASTEEQTERKQAAARENLRSQIHEIQRGGWMDKMTPAATQSLQELVEDAHWPFVCETMQDDGGIPSFYPKGTNGEAFCSKVREYFDQHPRQLENVVVQQPMALPQQQKPITVSKAIGVMLVSFCLGIVAFFVFLAIVISALSANAGESTTQRDGPTTRFYTPDGKSAGSASTYGNTTKFYGPDGKLTGSATRDRTR